MLFQNHSLTGWMRGLFVCVWCLGSVPRVAAQPATAPIVAIHDSELTRALESSPATGATPTGAGTTGFQWWPADWHYFVMPESLAEALRSDGTPFTRIGDSNITAGLLLPNGSPKYPIVISLAAEAIRDDEISPLTNYVAAGGFLFIGSSAFTRNPDGSSRGDFAFGNELGLHMWTPGLNNWVGNNGLTRQASHPLVDHLPDSTVYWRMPHSAEETNWGVSPSHQFQAPHDIWSTYVNDATVVAQGDSYPYLAIKRFGKGFFIYTAAFQPLIGHGGFAPGTYAYLIFRNAIDWAFETARLPVARLSPWPYAYDAAFMVRHDLENFAAEIANVEASAQVEHSLGAKGDYYFCTGTLRQDMSNSYDTNAVIASLRRAVGKYGATIGPHNGGLNNPNNANLAEAEYDFWHWGLDEALDTAPSGFSNGKDYARISLSLAFYDIENWLPNLMTNGFRVWCAPYFNATRENSYDIQEQLGVRIAGDQKLTPFPHWTLSTATSGKKYSFLSEPVSDWFVGGMIAQSLEPWHLPGVQTTNTMHQAVDFYYGLGALINFYSHTLSTGQGDAGGLTPDYIAYCVNTNLHPRLWSANGIDVYNWWTKRSSASFSVNYATNGSQATELVSLAGVSDPATTVEFGLPRLGTISALEVRTNGALVAAGGFRLGETLKISAGAATNAQIRYILAPAAKDDFFPAEQGVRADVAAPGVLGNDCSGLRPTLIAVLETPPAHGSLTLSSNGGFSYMPGPGFSGVDSFTYRASDGAYSSPPATAYMMVYPAGTLFADDFTFSVDPAPIDPWTAQSGNWQLTGGVMQGSDAPGSYGNAFYDAPSWSDYTVQAQVRFSTANGYGGGIGGRLNSTNGAHYAAWLFPESSPAGPALRLIKFEGWKSWSFTPMQTVNPGNLGTNWHTLALSFQSNNISVSLDGIQQINVLDNHFDTVPPYASGGITADLYSDAVPYTIAIDNVAVKSLTPPPTIVTQPAGATTNSGSTVSFSVTANGPAPLSYAWLKNGSNYLGDGGNASGCSTPKLTLLNVSANDAGTYGVLISNPGGNVTSASAMLSVTTAPPTIVTQPASVATNSGSTVAFSVTANGPGPLSYAWLKNGTNSLADGGNISGSATARLMLANVSAANAGAYSVRVTNPGGNVTSASATLTITTPNPPVITTQPQSQTVIAGNPVNFSVGASGGAPLHYQWRFKGSNMAGATSSTLTVANPQPTNAGQYSVLVSNNDGSVVSTAATLTVNFSLSVTSTRGGSVTVQPAASAYAPGTVVSLRATAQLGYDFTGWTGSASGTANPLSVTMNANKVITANFKVNLLGQLLGLL
jgi:uncharacterized repeat protein (TIGR02543 family)